MTVVLIFILIVMGLNLIPQLTKKKFPKTERVVSKLVIISTVTFLIATIFLFNGLRMSGFCISPIINVIFILTVLAYFSIVKNSKRKILIVLILIPLILLSSVTLIFSRKTYELEINNDHKIQVTTGGLMACGETINLTESKFGIFDKEIYHKGNLCLRDIRKIETIKFDEKVAEFLIFHDGEYDSENPYHYKIENKNVW